ncbi:hypothetical protein ASPZODRAFT_780573 [Penicilliopsis zonata CBS 506.65]|uniref:Uncharacterized protein n=1 Tax=Penicilliopsis zonata CBS 506.65 TaxID=1073090 RepID=A0A1L9SB35_9EURO|nr:hypothetical protein ASPZODRAFT_780573 [Penicilliopsis zonata CBS 506.65]OJJ44368.1 hypothetical protein ASPZODRAFT_780573 [Penicilliopsis zonata CBS 506.65]
MQQNHQQRIENDHGRPLRNINQSVLNFIKFRELPRQVQGGKHTGKFSSHFEAIPVGPSIKEISSPPAIKSTHLKTLKRHLLQQSDWAAVSVTRPLKITSTRADQHEHFGKRRKLTESDRERLGPDPVGLFTSQRGTNRKNTLPRSRWMVNGLHIGSGGISADTVVPCQKDKYDINDQSSQSMLLDNEEPFPPQESRYEYYKRQPSHSNSIQFNKSAEANLLFDDISNSPQYLSQAPQLNKQKLRHFTLDDQILAEQEGRLLAHSSSGRLDWSKYMPEEPESSSNQLSSWLPEPRDRVPLLIYSRPARNSTPSPSTWNGGANTSRHDSSPIKLFGQPVSHDLFEPSTMIPEFGITNN